MTINKSQGQSIDRLGIYLPEDVFTHGQLYVALSRGKRRDQIKVMSDRGPGAVSNIVYRDVFG
jgi:ATP-dependent exoDNAse (exonuclease V) alpha subunit